MTNIEKAVADMESIMMNNRRNMMEQLGSRGKGELFILKYLQERDAAVVPSQISEVMHTSTARISAALGSLEKKGQIHREIDTRNRRNILVTITQKGLERIRSDSERMRERMIDVFEEMGEADALELVRLMKRMMEISDRVFGNIPP